MHIYIYMYMYTYMCISLSVCVRIYVYICVDSGRLNLSPVAATRKIVSLRSKWLAGES